MSHSVLHGDCLDVLRTMETASIDACVTDPPYELGFMGKKWDSTGIAYRVDLWAEVLRVLKPGAHLVAFGGSRTYHRMACAIEDAGFQIRDSLMWLQGQGFPKSLNLPGGIGTALKPAHEPIVLARKPLGSTVEACVALHGTGGLNIDACRIAGEIEDGGGWATAGYVRPRTVGTFSEGVPVSTGLAVTVGRWPANVLFDEAASAMLDAQSGDLNTPASYERRADASGGILGKSKPVGMMMPGYGDSGGASRFFYTAKPSRDERDAGLDDLEPRTHGDITGRVEGSPGIISPRSGAGRTAGGVKNHHPTVKPVAVMEWLIDLVTPLGGLVLDPFCGSGTSGIAAVRRARSFVGIEREAEYVEIATRRIAHWSKGQLDLLGRIA